MKVSIIVAVAANGVIGNKGKIPWHLPDDLKRFKKITTGHHIIMGRKTHESIDKPLPDRTNVIVTNNHNYTCHKECIVVHSVSAALEMAEKSDEEEAFVIGGAEIYKQVLPIADRIYMTKIDKNFKGNTYFPKVDTSEWKTRSKESLSKDPNLKAKLLVLSRKKPGDVNV